MNIKRLIVLLIPTFLRQSKFIAWLFVLSKPLEMLYSDFVSYKLKTGQNLKINGQVCYLRKALNDEFDPYLRRIKIYDAVIQKGSYLYKISEKKPQYLGKLYLYSSLYLSEKGSHFIVEIPSELNPKTYKIETMINYYKLAGKKYIIKN